MLQPPHPCMHPSYLSYSIILLVSTSTPIHVADISHRSMAHILTQPPSAICHVVTCRSSKSSRHTSRFGSLRTNSTACESVFVDSCTLYSCHAEGEPCILPRSTTDSSPILCSKCFAASMITFYHLKVVLFQILLVSPFTSLNHAYNSSLARKLTVSITL